MGTRIVGAYARLDRARLKNSHEAGNAARKLDESIEFVGTFGSRRYATDLVAGRLLDHEIDGLPLRPQAAGHKRELGHEAYTMYGAALIWI